MTILIKGMKMPKAGDFITLQICGDGTVRVVNKATGGVYTAPTFEEANGTDKRIKASSVPASHGRLGDLNKLINHIDNKYWDSIWIKSTALSMIEQEIRNAPTVIEAEEG